MSTSELLSLMKAREGGDIQRGKFLLSGGSEIISTQSFGEGGGGQLAQLLGVDASGRTSAELGAMYLDAHD